MKKYPINWKLVWFKISKVVLKILLGFILLLFALKSFSTGFSFNNFFELSVIYLKVSCGMIVLSLLIATFMRLLAVSISDSELSGLNYWGFRKIIPFTDIKEIKFSSLVSKNDIVIVSSHNNGEVFISSSTTNLDELLEILNKNKLDDKED